MKKIAIVGRPNVGKSTLVNRLVGKRETIVEEKPGVTRDRRSLKVEFGGNNFEIIDTGGWMGSVKTIKNRKGMVIEVERSLDEKVSLQSELAIDEADAIVLVVDSQVGVTSEDEQIAKMITKRGVPCVVAVNKVDNAIREAQTWEFLKLGLGDPIPISALHGLGTGDLIEATINSFDQDGEQDLEEEGDGSFHVAIAGRPNVGKSTLFNRLIGSERVIVHDMAGTTRDPVDTRVETEQGPLTFIDTAGLKKQSRQADNTEYYSSLRSFSAIEKADCVLFVVDGTEGITHFDMRLLERIDAAGCALVILLNKWDTLDTEQRVETLKKAKKELGFVDYAPILTISALSGRNFDKIIPALFDARDNYEQRIPTAQLNKVIHEAQIAHPHPNRSNKRVDNSYLRYLENTLRDKFDLGSTSIKLRVRKKAD